MEEQLYTLSKGELDDPDCKILSNYLHNNLNEYANIRIEDNSPVSSIFDSSGLFENMSNVKVINLQGLNTGYSKNTHNMFYHCYNLTSVSNFNTSNVTDMSYMFYYCNSLTSIPEFNTSNATNMASMFRCCDNLTSVPNYDTSNVTSMYYMFSTCNNLTSIPNFDTSNVTNMGRMLYNCKNLTSVPEFDTSNVIYMNCMFGACNNLSDAAIQNIVNMCLNATNILASQKTLKNSFLFAGPFALSNIANTRYENRWSELTAAGWNY